jgi:hypothetical protein
MKKIRLTVWLAVLAILLVPGPVQAKSPADDIIVGGTFTLHSGETYNGDLVSLGGKITLEEGSTVDGNVVVIGGSLQVAGRVTENMASIGGSIHLSATAVIDGDLACIGGEPEMDEGAKVVGKVKSVAGVTFPVDFSVLVQPTEISQWVNQIGIRNLFWANPLFEATAFLFRVLIFSAIAVLIVMFLPKQTERIAGVLMRNPVPSFLVGLLTMMIAGAVSIILIITICLSPAGLLGLAILFASTLLGWTAIGLEVGKAVATLFRQQLHPAAVAGIGTMVLTFLAGAVWYFPCVGGILVLMALSFGLGAVVLTRFGGQPYLPAQIPPAVQSPTDTPLAS